MPIALAPQLTQRAYRWTAFIAVQAIKTMCLQWDDDGETYTIWGYDGPEVHVCTIWKGEVPNAVVQAGYSQEQNDADKTAFEGGIKLSGNKRISEPTDDESSHLIRPKTTHTGWMQQFRCFDFTSAKWNSLISRRPDTGAQLTDCTLKFFDANGDQITAEENIGSAVRTEMDFEPAWDYDIAGGFVFLHEALNEDVHAWVVAVPDLPPEYGGYKVNMCGGLNLRFLKPGTPLILDGRTPKRLTYNAAYHTNKMRVILRHSAGYQARIMLVLDTYRG